MTKAANLQIDRCGYDGHRPEYVEPRNMAEWEKADEIPRRNANVDRINWLYEHKMIEEREYKAADRLQRDWEKSLVMPFSSGVVAGNSGGITLPNDAKIAAMRRHGAAMDHLGPVGKAKGRLMVVQIVEKQNTIEEAAQNLGWGTKFARGVLVCALDRLADYYGL